MNDDFLRRSIEAGNRAKECLQKADDQFEYRQLHDEALAEFYVYNRLHGRAFTDDPALLREELKVMLDETPPETEAMDPEIFEQQRLSVIRRLLEQSPA